MYKQCLCPNKQKYYSISSFFLLVDNVGHFNLYAATHSSNCSCKGESSNILKPTFKPESDKQFLQSSFKKLKRAISTNASPLHISDEVTSHSHALKLVDNTKKQLLNVWACLHQCHQCVITEL